MFRLYIDKLTFSGGEEIQLKPGSTLIIIGPNSSGKSTALLDIHGLLSNPNHSSKVISDISYTLDGSQEDFTSWIETNYHYILRQGTRSFATLGQEIREDNIPGVWKHLQQKQQLQKVLNFVCNRLDTESRLQIGNSTNSMNVFENTPSMYIHVLQRNEELLNEISANVREAFGVDLIINWAGGGHVWFHIGSEPERTMQSDRVSGGYVDKLRMLPRLEEEGDGIRSYVGALLAAKCGAQHLILIDEPEAFLHPPQIRRLSSILSRNTILKDQQLIIATHSSDVIQGCLSDSSNVSICRITRDGDKNHAFLLDTNQITELWKKPLLRSSASIDGVFHNGVVVTEGDSDSRFYEALAQHIDASNVFQEPLDLYFVHGGGKGELNTLAMIYKELGVPVAAIADLDLLRNKAEFVKVLTSLGHGIKEIEPLYNSTTSALNDLPPQISLKEFLIKSRKILDEIEEQNNFTSPNRKKISELLNYSGDWSEAKKYGIRKLSGGAFDSSKLLIEKCLEWGLFLVPFGELESWWTGGPADKNQWFINAITKINEDPDSLTKASKFIELVIKYLNSSLKEFKIDQILD